MLEIGLKLWSSNLSFIPVAQRLYDQGLYRYIELYSVPGTFSDHIGPWKRLPMPFVIHAPHSGHGVNLSRPECAAANTKLIAEARRFADELESEWIILHPGVAGNIDETVRQIKTIADSRLLIENKPYFSVYDHAVCNGYSPRDIRHVMDETGLGFCLDFSHALSAANALKVDHREWLAQFAQMNPRMFHLSDGDNDGVDDKHLSLGQGSYDLPEIVAFLPGSAKVTLETEKDEGLQRFQADVRALDAARGAA